MARPRFAVGALLAGAIASAWGLIAAIWVVAALTTASGLLPQYVCTKPPQVACSPAGGCASMIP